MIGRAQTKNEKRAKRDGGYLNNNKKDHKMPASLCDQ
jgi:hypothetical protein